MASVYVSGRDLPIVLEFIDQDSAEVADPVEDWCQRGEVATFKRLPTRVVINFGQASMSGSQAWPVVMMAGRPTTYRRVDARSPALCETSRYGECDERQRVQKRSERR
jgi:hypothetical protein